VSPLHFFSTSQHSFARWCPIFLPVHTTDVVLFSPLCGSFSPGLVIFSLLIVASYHPDWRRGTSCFSFASSSFPPRWHVSCFGVPFGGFPRSLCFLCGSLVFGAPCCTPSFPPVSISLLCYPLARVAPVAGSPPPSPIVLYSPGLLVYNSPNLF